MSSDIDEDSDIYSAIPKQGVQTENKSETIKKQSSQQLAEARKQGLIQPVTPESRKQGIVNPVFTTRGLLPDIKESEKGSVGMLHSYVNLVDRSDDEDKPALPARRDRQRCKTLNTRKSRSKDRAQRVDGQDSQDLDNGTEYERIKEREEELERVHRRSRELMMSPREIRGRDGSSERGKRGKVLEQHFRMSASNAQGPAYLNHPAPPCHPPPSKPSSHYPPPPPCHPPPPLPSSTFHSRYKSPSPGSYDMQQMQQHKQQYGNHDPQHYKQPGQQHGNHEIQNHYRHIPGTGGDLPGMRPGDHQVGPVHMRPGDHQVGAVHMRGAGGPNNNTLRRRVQSPNRRDFKDFTSIRDIRSPNRVTGRMTDEEEDSGADSMNELSSHSCRSPVHSNHSSHMALVPYDPRASCRSCCSGGWQGHMCSSQMYHPQNMQVALPASFEDRLLALEGDKDQLHLQVALLSDQIDNQTDKITDLEGALDNKKETLRVTEDALQREILNRSSLETQKLELMSEISSLKLRQTSCERENVDLRRRLQKLTDPGFDGTRSLPRRPSYKADLFTPLPWQPSTFKPAHLPDREPESTPSSKGESKTSFFRRNSIRHKSVPNTRTRDLSIDRSADSEQNPIATKPKGLKKILSRMRRAHSGHIPQEIINDSDKEHRASAGSKIVSSWEEHHQRTSNCFQPDTRIQDWDAETICAWFHHIGLYMYSNEVSRVIKDGVHLSSLSSSDLETKLGIKNLLHRKKVMLAISSKQSGEEDPASRLDHQWVTRWLDDVGLPQYKDAFMEARVDGRVLNYLTIDDLFQLKVTNQLHHLSIKWGIEVLRSNRFDPSCLKRRGNPGERDSQIIHSDVIYWTNHRVMEWLRHVDLAEYAPNLRGSGVHGALIVQEDRFTVELMASLLSIPTSKSLLRRHLSLHFKDLVGPDVIQTKRTAENSPEHQPLTPNSRAKHSKKGQFTLKRKKSKAEVDFEDMLCPLK